MSIRRLKASAAASRASAFCRSAHNAQNSIRFRPPIWYRVGGFLCPFAVRILVINIGNLDVASAWTLIHIQWNTLREFFCPDNEIGTRKAQLRGCLPPTEYLLPARSRPLTRRRFHSMHRRVSDLSPVVGASQ